VADAGDIPYTAPKKKLVDGKQLDLNEAAANGAEDNDNDEGREEDEYAVLASNLIRLTSMLKRTPRYTVEKIKCYAFDEENVCTLSFIARNRILMRSRVIGVSKVRGGLGRVGRPYLGTGGEHVSSRRIYL